MIAIRIAMDPHRKFGYSQDRRENSGAVGDKRQRSLLTTVPEVDIEPGSPKCPRDDHFGSWQAEKKSHASYGTHVTI